MMCAMRIAVVPRGILRLRKRVSNEEPMTTSGVAIGMKMSRFVDARPRNRCRPSAKARRGERGDEPDLEAQPERRAHPGGVARVLPRVQREPGPGVVEAAVGLVEAEQHDHDVGQQHVLEREHSDDEDHVLAQPPHRPPAVDQGTDEEVGEDGGVEQGEGPEQRDHD
jgi:hypothetical protein